MKNLQDVLASYIIKKSGIQRRKFFDRVLKRSVSYIQPFNGERYYSIKDWNKKNPDYEVKE